MQSILGLIVSFVLFGLLFIFLNRKFPDGDKDQIKRNNIKIDSNYAGYFPVRPNTILVWRAVFGTVGVFYIYYGDLLFGTSLYFFCALSDTFDGLMARRCELVTEFGKFMDPLVDKYMNFTAFSAFILKGSPVAFWFILIYLTTELYNQFIVRYWANQEGSSIAAKNAGKQKTIFVFSFQFYLVLILEWKFLNFSWLIVACEIACILLSLRSIYSKIPAGFIRRIESKYPIIKKIAVT